jgi:hypothetical protein
LILGAFGGVLMTAVILTINRRPMNPNRLTFQMACFIGALVVIASAIFRPQPRR